MSITIHVQPRDKTGSKASKKLREQELVPAILYGAGEQPTALTVQLKDFEKTWKEAGESTVVSVQGLSKDLDVLIQDVAVDPIYGAPMHVDFYAVRKDVKVEVEVELVFVGVAPAEKELGGSLIKVMHEVAIEALPKDLPHTIDVDISALVTFEDQIHVRDLVLPAGVVAVTDAEEVVALVQPAREEEPEEPTGDVSTIEVAQKGKEETDSE